MPTIILGRDGVINQTSTEHIKSADEWHALPGSLPAIARLSQNGYHVVVATNQAGLASGRLTIEGLVSINQKMLSHLAQYGGVIEAIFFCPAGVRDKNSDCRKPNPTMFIDIASRLRANLADVPCIGDKLSDLQAARAAGAKPVLVRTGHGEKLVRQKKVPEGVAIYDNLAEFVNELLAN